MLYIFFSRFEGTERDQKPNIPHPSHPAECNMYLQCSNGYEYIFTCPLELVFNEILQVCDYVENVPECNGETTTSTATTTISGKEK